MTIKFNFRDLMRVTTLAAGGHNYNDDDVYDDEKETK